MARWETQVKGLAETLRQLDPKAFRKVLRGAAGPILRPVIRDARQRAPVGKTGKLRRGIRMRVRVKRDLIEVMMLLTAPHGHLVDRGHKIVARGPSRTGLGDRSDDTLSLRRRRIALRSGLLSRRASGGRGFVAGRRFVRAALEAQGGERGLANRLQAELSRALVR